MKKKSNSQKKSKFKKKTQTLNHFHAYIFFNHFLRICSFFVQKSICLKAVFKVIYRFLCQKGSISTKKCNKIYMRKPVPESKFFFLDLGLQNFLFFFWNLDSGFFLRGLSSNFFGIQTQDFFGIYFFCGTQTPYFFESKFFFLNLDSRFFFSLSFFWNLDSRFFFGSKFFFGTQTS